MIKKITIGMALLCLAMPAADAGICSLFSGLFGGRARGGAACGGQSAYSGASCGYGYVPQPVGYSQPIGYAPVGYAPTYSATACTTGTCPQQSYAPPIQSYAAPVGYYQAQPIPAYKSTSQACPNGYCPAPQAKAPSKVVLTSATLTSATLKELPPTAVPEPLDEQFFDLEPIPPKATPLPPAAEDVDNNITSDNNFWTVSTNSGFVDNSFYVAPTTLVARK